MDEQKRGNFSTTEREWDLEEFCRIGVGLGIFCPGRENFWLGSILSEGKREEELDSE